MTSHLIWAIGVLGDFLVLWALFAARVSAGFLGPGFSRLVSLWGQEPTVPQRAAG
jgi:hypothetical protein